MVDKNGQAPPSLSSIRYFFAFFAQNVPNIPMQFPSLARIGAIVFAGLLVVNSNALAGPARQEVRCPSSHTVNAEVGLVVRAHPNSNSDRVGSVKYGQVVRVVGDKVEGAKGIIASLIEDKQTPGTWWVKIKDPYVGFVLYKADGYQYLTPGKGLGD